MYATNFSTSQRPAVFGGGSEFFLSFLRSIGIVRPSARVSVNFPGKITGVSKKLTPASRSLEAEIYFRLRAKKRSIEAASMAVITSPTFTESRLLRTTVHFPANG